MSSAFAEHFQGCHPDDEQAPEKPEGYQPLDTEPCWHCGTLTTLGTCRCPDEWMYADYVPPSAAYHCRTCGRWWAYMKLNVTRIDFGPTSQVRGPYDHPEGKWG